MAFCAKPPFTNRSNYNRPGSSRATLKRGSSLCSIQPFPRTGLRKLLICNPKEGRGSQTGHKSKTSQQFHPIRTLQNGVYSHAERSSKKRGLYGKNRPEGCIPDSAGLEEPPEIPSVFVERFSARVCVPTLWSSQCSTGIHQTTETITVSTKAERNSPHCISGRYPPYGSFETASPSACVIYSESPGRTWVHSELSKVCSRTFPTNGVFRVPGGFCKPKSKPSQEQDKKDSVKLSTAVRKPSNFSKGIVKIPGPPILLYSGSLSSSPPLSVPPTSRECGTKIPEIVRGPSNLRLRGTSGGTVVERQSDSMEWVWGIVSCVTHLSTLT